VFLLLPLLVLRRRQIDSPLAGWRSSLRRSIVVVVATCVALLLALGIKVLTQTRLTFHYRFLKRLGLVFKHTVLQAVDFNFVRYGLSMPQVLWRILRQYPDLRVLALGAAL